MQPTSSPLNRRQFIQKTGMAAGALIATQAFAADHLPKTPLTGSQLYGWGQYYQRMGKNLWDNLDEVFSALRDAGYDYAEGTLDLNNPDNNAGFAERLRKKGLQPVSYYTGGRLHDDVAEETVEKIVAAAKVCKESGFRVINCNPDPIGREKTDEELKTQVRALTQLGTELNKLGMRLGIHHHTPAMQNDAREFHYNFKNSEPEVVGFCFDVHWVYRGGVKPMDALKDYGDRIVSWHLRQSRDQIWWEDLARGDIDYRAVAAYAKEHRLTPYYTVELAIEDGTKITRTVVENHARSRDFVKRVFGV